MPSFIRASDNRAAHQKEPWMSFFLHSHPWIFPINFWRIKKKKKKGEENMSPEKDISWGMLFIMIGQFLLA